MNATCLAGQLWWGPGLIALGLVFAVVQARLVGQHEGLERGLASHEHPCTEHEPPRHVRTIHPMYDQDAEAQR